MNCPHITAFLSCSFRDEDKMLNDFIKCICEALNIICKNVSNGYASPPPETARGMIEESKIFIAVIPKREEMKSGNWTMPNAVHEELAMSYALKKPALIFLENGVTTEGFIQNYGTFIPFERTKLYENDFIKKSISSLHELRLQAVDQHNLLPEQDAAGFYAEYISFLIEASKENDEPTWIYNTSRKLIFLRPFSGQIKNSAWVEYLPEGITTPIKHDFKLELCRDDLNPKTEVLKNSPQQVEIATSFEGKPQKDDWVDFEFTYSSPHLNRLNKSEVSEDKRTKINGKLYDCIDGLIPIQPTRFMHVQLRFPQWYKIEKDSIFPFVGSYSAGIDYVLESEIKRCQIDITKFGGSTQIDIRVESPLMRHVYGVAWNLEKIG